MRLQHYIDLAINNAMTSECVDFKHGAMLMRNGKIIQYGVNSSDRTKIGGLYLPGIHAEFDACHRHCRGAGQCFLWGQI